jgi:O-antigen/teichoic acid export membrane protein
VKNARKESKLISSISVGTAELSAEARMAKNSFALLLFAILTQGAGLIVAVLIARYLGAAALGTYAAVLGLSLLLESIAPLGLQFVIIRQVARDRARLYSFWLNTSVATLLISTILSITLVVVIHRFVNDSEYLKSAYIVALFLPIAGLYVIAQAFVQGLEEMEMITISALIGRVVGLLVLWLLLQSGMRVAAAFIGYGVYQLMALLAICWAILRKAGLSGAIREAKFDLVQCWTSLRLSVPFAIQNILRSGSAQINVLILPLLVTMKIVGMFDAANRIRQTSVMIIPIVTLSILPTLSRTVLTDRERAMALTETAIKLLNVLILPFVFFSAIAADQIIPLLYGSGYEAAVPVLRVVVWAQVFFAVDAMLNQILMASNNEVPMVRNTALSLGVNVILLLVLTSRYGVIAAAWIVVVTTALNLALDVWFVSRHITPFKLFGTISKPLLCAIISGGIALVTHSHGLWVTLVSYFSSYFILFWVFRVFTDNELLLARQLIIQLWRRVMALKEQQH